MEVVLVRHGETEWSRDGKHTGHTDVPLTDRGREQARVVGEALRGRDFALILTSPLSRALETCRLAGFGDRAEQRDDLMEWDYGAYEGRTTPRSGRSGPAGRCGEDGVPERRDDRRRCRSGSIASSQRSGRSRATRSSSPTGTSCECSLLAGSSCGADAGPAVALDPATLSTLGYERETPVIRLWNERA